MIGGKGGRKEGGGGGREMNEAWWENKARVAAVGWKMGTSD